MTALAKARLNVEQFLAWSQSQAGRWELVGGVPVAMAPERALHGRVKYLVAKEIERAIAAAGLDCAMFLDSLAVRVDEETAYLPDVLVNCGDPVSDDALEAPNPIVVVEVLSPSTAWKDNGPKLADYFRVPSIQHYLIVDPDKRLVLWHGRSESEVILTRIVREGPITLDPPGLRVETGAFFPAD